MSRILSETSFEEQVESKPSLLQLITQTMMAFCTVVGTTYSIIAHVVSTTAGYVRSIIQCVLHYTYYRRGAGYAFVGDCRKDEADGVVYVRGHSSRDVHNRSTVLDAVYFRLENRWLTRAIRPSNRVIFQIMTQAKLQGLKVHSIGWKGEHVSPFDFLDQSKHVRTIS